MKQRIRAEAHGAAPSCRNHPLAGASSAATTAAATALGVPCDDTAGGTLTQHSIPLQR
ncbi:hypothetical protein STPH1_3570 [Streptomyces sp. OM5714]|nr:hypothetical protein STPH1_3570 [Streptomyces sp. OM5714]